MLDINFEEKPYNNRNAYYILMSYKILHFLYIKLTKYSTYIPLCISIRYLLFIYYLLGITIQNIHLPEVGRITQMWSA